MCFENNKPNKEIIGKIRKGLDMDNSTKHLLIKKTHRCDDNHNLKKTWISEKQSDLINHC